MTEHDSDEIIAGQMCMDDVTRGELSDFLASVAEQIRHMRRALEDGICVSELLDHSAAVRAAMSTFADAIGRADNTTCGGACLNAGARTRLQRIAGALRDLQK